MPDNVKKKYRIEGSAFRFKRKTFPERSEIELTDEEYKAECKKITLCPVNLKEAEVEPGEPPGPTDDKPKTRKKSG